MFVSVLSYTRSVSHDDPLYEAHRDFVMAQTSASKMLCAGPRVGAAGGVLLVYGDDEPAVRALLDQDPYVGAGVASYELFQFKVGLSDPASTLAGA